MDTLLHDLRYAWRTLGRNPAFTATALVVLALGIGVNTSIYTVVRGLALRPLPFDSPDRLMFIGELGPGGRREPMAPANFVDLALQSRAFERMAIHRGTRFILTGRSVPESVVGANVSSTFFSVLRMQAQQVGTGRPFAVGRQMPASRDAAPTAVYRVATADYFATIGIPLISGRYCSPADGPETPAVAIVNQTLRARHGQTRIRPVNASS